MKTICQPEAQAGKASLAPQGGTVLRPAPWRTNRPPSGPTASHRCPAPHQIQG